MNVVNVQIVRPKRSGWQLLGDIVFVMARYLVSGWILMAILEEVSPWHPSYWHSILIVVAARTLTSTGEYLLWTKDAK